MSRRLIGGKMSESTQQDLASVIDTLFDRLAGDVRSEANFVSTGGTPTGYELAMFKELLESK